MAEYKVIVDDTIKDGQIFLHYEDGEVITDFTIEIIIQSLKSTFTRPAPNFVCYVCNSDDYLRIKEALEAYSP